MKRSWISALIRIQLLGITSFFLQSCGAISTQRASASCPAATAVIEVHDSFVRRVCGCVESNNANFDSSGTLTCTAPVGTYYNLYFVNTTAGHSFSIFGTSVFQPAGSGTQVYSYRSNQTGPFNFSDGPSGVNGTFTITP